MSDEGLTSGSPFEAPLDRGLAQRREERKDLMSENPFESPLERSALPQAEVVGRGFKLTIADILFCTFAVSLSLMFSFQRWGGFEGWNSIHFASGILVALSASVFFTANRRRREFGLEFSELEPGHCVALLGGGFLASYVFQFLVSFLDEAQVGAPIHIVARFSTEIFNIGLCLFLLYRTAFTPRWRAFFIVACGYSVIFGLSVILSMFGKRFDLQNPLTRAAVGLWHLGDKVWYLCGILLVVAYLLDIVAKEKRDWLHHAGVLSVIAAGVASIFYRPFVQQLFWTMYYDFFGP